MKMTILMEVTIIHCDTVEENPITHPASFLPRIPLFGLMDQLQHHYEKAFLISTLSMLPLLSDISSSGTCHPVLNLLPLLAGAVSKPPAQGWPRTAGRAGQTSLAVTHKPRSRLWVAEALLCTRLSSHCFSKNTEPQEGEVTCPGSLSLGDGTGPGIVLV